MPKVMVEHERPYDLLQPLPISEWKWEDITIDFLTGLPHNQNGHDSIWVVVDILTKSTYFLPRNQNSK